MTHDPMHRGKIPAALLSRNRNTKPKRTEKKRPGFVSTNRIIAFERRRSWGTRTFLLFRISIEHFMCWCEWFWPGGCADRAVPLSFRIILYAFIHLRRQKKSWVSNLQLPILILDFFSLLFLRIMGFANNQINICTDPPTISEECSLTPNWI